MQETQISQGYIHAEQMMEFAEDAAKFPRPWELWEVKVGQGKWGGLTCVPAWVAALTFRRHKHADLIGAWQLGAEVQMKVGESWSDVDPKWMSRYEYRIKPKTININGIEVPEPLREPLKSGQWVCVVDPAAQGGWSRLVWSGVRSDEYCLSMGIIHLTEEAAIAHAKALLSFTKGK